MLASYAPRSYTYARTYPTKRSSIDEELVPDVKDAEEEEQTYQQQRVVRRRVRRIDEEEEEEEEEDQESESSEYDSDYDPRQDAELSLDDAYEFFDAEEEEEEEEESESESDDFDRVLSSIKKVGNVDGQAILENVCADYYDEEGVELDRHILSKALRSIDLIELGEHLIAEYDEEDEEEEEEEEEEESSEYDSDYNEETDEEDYEEADEYLEQEQRRELRDAVPEMSLQLTNEVLDIIEVKGIQDQDYLASVLIETYKELNGVPPTFAQLMYGFESIKQVLMREFDLVTEEYEEEEDDSDYDEEDDEEEEYSEDEEERVYDYYYDDKVSEASSDSEDDEDVEAALDEAIEIAQQMGECDREDMIEKISEEYYEENGREISKRDLADAFELTRRTVMSSLLGNEEDDLESDEDDSDYDPESDEFDYNEDIMDEYYLD